VKKTVSFIVGVAVLMYFVPALAAVGAVVYLVRIALSTEPVSSEEPASEP
jgi:hypothetical protein